MQKGILTAANQQKDRPKHSGDSNRFPILMIAYIPTTDTSLTQITNKQLGELAYALATCSNPKPTTKDEKRITWHKPNSKDEKTDLAIPYFEHTKPHHRPQTTEPDSPNAILDDDECTDGKNSAEFNADSRPTTARLFAGRITDISRSIDRMLATRAATLPETLGANIGSLHMHHQPKRQARQCPCCRAFTTVGVTFPITAEKTQTNPADQHLKKLANQLKQQIFKKIVTDDLSEWAVPTEKLDRNTTAHK